MAKSLSLINDPKDIVTVSYVDSLLTNLIDTDGILTLISAKLELILGEEI